MGVNKINILLADDHVIVRGGIKAILEKHDNLNITGEASNGLEVINMLENGTNADIIILDINMPGLNGLDLTEIIREKFPKIKIIILSALDNEKYVVKAFRAGAHGYLLKNISTREMIFAIHHTSEFGPYVCAELAGRFLNRLLLIPDPVTHENINNIEFSSRDIELLELISQGFTNQEISDKLFSNVRTIENQRQQLINKTDSRNTVSLIRFAILNGVI